MKCKYKSSANEKLCQAIEGECQFLDCQYGKECSIYNAYPNLDAYIVEQMAKNDPDGVAHLGNIEVIDDAEAQTETLYIERN